MLPQVLRRVTTGVPLSDITAGSHLTTFARLWSFAGPALKENSTTSAYVGRIPLPVRFCKSLAPLS